MGCCGSKVEDGDCEDVTICSAPRQVVATHEAASCGRGTPSRGLAAPVSSRFAYPAPSRLHARTKFQRLPQDPDEPVLDSPPTIIASIWDVIRRPEADRDEVESIGYSPHHNEERHFFQVFFSVLDHVPGHQGIFRRWEREAQRAEGWDPAGRCDMSKVWFERVGYVKSLQRVKMLVHKKQFRPSDREKLAEWAAKVVKRRTAEYNKAKSQGRGDPQHLKVLEEWKGVREAVLDLL